MGLSGMSELDVIGRAVGNATSPSESAVVAIPLGETNSPPDQKRALRARRRGVGGWGVWF